MRTIARKHSVFPITDIPRLWIAIITFIRHRNKESIVTWSISRTTITTTEITRLPTRPLASTERVWLSGCVYVFVWACVGLKDAWPTVGRSRSLQGSARARIIRGLYTVIHYKRIFILYHNVSLSRPFPANARRSSLRIARLIKSYSYHDCLPSPDFPVHRNFCTCEVSFIRRENSRFASRAACFILARSTDHLLTTTVILQISRVFLSAGTRRFRKQLVHLDVTFRDENNFAMCTRIFCEI